MNEPSIGLYDQLLNAEWTALLEGELGRNLIFRTATLEEEHATSYLVGHLTQQLDLALRTRKTKVDRIELANLVIDFLSDKTGLDFLRARKVVSEGKDWLLEVVARGAAVPLPRPETPLSTSSLFTGSSGGPQLARELDREIRSADRIDALLSFIKWTGLRLLQDAFAEFVSRGGHLRVLTTSYMGASDPNAVEWLAKLPRAQVKVSYDTKHTRLHAKAHYFQRDTGFSTAYIGSANMSSAAMTSGLEWNLKVTAQESPHILARCVAEFASYWNNPTFEKLDPAHPAKLRRAIAAERKPSSREGGLTFYADITPHGYQDDVLEKLRIAREVHGHHRNLVVAATGCGKTVISAFDFKRYRDRCATGCRLLFIAHRREILEQSVGCFRQVLRNQNFGELWVGPHKPDSLDHLFCSIQTFNSQRIWELVHPEFYDYIVVDEVHHGAAASYERVFEHLRPSILLGLTATPERADDQSIEHYFDRPFAAEIRLPDALDLKLLCPFQYFAVSDSVSYQGLTWTRGKYAEAELDNLLTGNDARALHIVDAIRRYEPSQSDPHDIDRDRLKGLGFCAGKRHAAFMAAFFRKAGIPAAALDSDTDDATRQALRNKLRTGEINFLFVVDIFNEGVDIPEINCVLFLRPTESPVVFLQQLGRGLRHAEKKECLTVLDFVGQCHQKFRYDLQFRALLPRDRRIEREVEEGFPHLPPGCSIILEKQARRVILENIKRIYRDSSVRVREGLQTFERETGRPLTFSNFIDAYQDDPIELLGRKTWSDWKHSAGLCAPVSDPDHAFLKGALARVSCLRSPRYLNWLHQLASARNLRELTESEFSPLAHYLLWNQPGAPLGVTSLTESFQKLGANPCFLRDVAEVADYSLQFCVPGVSPALPFNCPMELHGKYFMREITAAFGKATLETSGPAGTGVIHLRNLKTYLLLITFQKSEKDYSPTTMYRDYVISRDLIHWETQASTASDQPTGQNFICQRENGYTILLFTRPEKKISGIAAPYSYLGPGHYVDHQGNRPIGITWKLRHQMPVETELEGKKAAGL